MESSKLSDALDKEVLARKKRKLMDQIPIIARTVKQLTNEKEELALNIGELQLKKQKLETETQKLIIERNVERNLRDARLASGSPSRLAANPNPLPPAIPSTSRSSMQPTLQIPALPRYEYLPPSPASPGYASPEPYVPPGVNPGHQAFQYHASTIRSHDNCKLNPVRGFCEKPQDYWDALIAAVDSPSQRNGKFLYVHPSDNLVYDVFKHPNGQIRIKFAKGRGYEVLKKPDRPPH